MSQTGEALSPVFSRRIIIEWGDCDAAGIVFYPRYFAMFNESTVRMFDTVFGPQPQMLARFGIIGLPMVDTSARFITPNSYGDRMTIETEITRWGASSFDVAHRLLNRQGDLSARAAETRVWTGVDPDRPGGLKGKAIPEEVKRSFAGFVGDGSGVASEGW